MPNPHGLYPLESILAELMAVRGYGQNLAVQQRETVWQSLLEDSFIKQTRCGSYRRGILEILVNNSTILQELNMRKPELVQQLRARLPQHQIRDLRFRIATDIR